MERQSNKVIRVDKTCDYIQANFNGYDPEMLFLARVHHADTKMIVKVAAFHFEIPLKRPCLFLDNWYHPSQTRKPFVYIWPGRKIWFGSLNHLFGFSLQYPHYLFIPKFHVIFPSYRDRPFLLSQIYICQGRNIQVIRDTKEKNYGRIMS